MDDYTGFTRSTGGSTTSNSTGGVSTSSSQATTSRTRATYNSTTTTRTTTANVDATTTQGTTRSIITSTTGNATTSTSETLTVTTSTTTPGIITQTTLSTAASSVLTAPEWLVPVSIAAATEQAWEVTNTTDSAGYASHIASTFASRIGTLSMTTTALATTHTSTFTAIVTQSNGATGTLSLTTSRTLTSADTYFLANGLLPAATATRTFTLLSTSLSTLAVITSRTVNSTLTGHATNWISSTVTIQSVLTASVPFTYNVSPTATSTAALYATWSGSTSLALRRFASEYATSSSTTTVAGGPGTYTEAGTAAGTFNDTTTSATDTTATANTTLTFPDIGTTTTTTTVNAPAGGSAGETRDETSTTYTYSLRVTSSSSTTVLDGGFTHSEYTNVSEDTHMASTGYSSFYTSGITTSGGFGVGTVYSTTSASAATTMYTDYLFTSSLESLYNFAYSSSTITGSTSQSGVTPATASGTLSYTFTVPPLTVGSTTTYDTTTSFTATTTGTATTTTATTTTVSGTYAVTNTANFTSSSGSSESRVQGISYTYPKLYPQITRAASAAWSAHQMFPRQGFRDPLHLGGTDSLFANLSVSPAGTISYTPAGVQDAPGGPSTPMLLTDESQYSSGSSTYAARWDTSDSRLHYSSGVAYSYTTTTGTSTITRTSTSATSTKTVSFTGDTPMTWFSNHSSSGTAGSLAGGVARSEFGAAVFVPPGVFKITQQFGGTSTSSRTTWLTSMDLAATFSEGYAMPTRTESVWSVSQQQTSWSYLSLISGGDSTGSTSRPVLTLSLNPNL